MHPRVALLGGFALVIGTAALVWRHDVYGGATKVLRIESDAVYQSMSVTDMARQASVIVAGQVVGVTPTRWNQDSGAYWEESVATGTDQASGRSANPYYEVHLRVDRPLVNESSASIEAGRVMVLTIVGTSPIDSASPQASSGVMTADSIMGLAEGQSAVFFVRPTYLAWRSGHRAVLTPIGKPSLSYLTYGSVQPRSDGPISSASQDEALNALTQRIMALRSNAANE